MSSGSINLQPHILNGVSYIDAHIHLADAQYAGKQDAIILESAQHNVSQMLSNATDHQSTLETIKLAGNSAGHVLAAVGVHPSATLRPTNLNLDKLEGIIEENSELIAAIGEIGLDGKYTQDAGIKAKQKEVFRYLLGLAEKKNLPVVVHSRQAVSEALDCLADFRVPTALFHWYDGPVENLPILKERGYMISIGPALLYSRKISEIACAVDANLILTETDGPVNYRGLFGGELTKPWFVLEVVAKLAEVRKTSPVDMRSMISSNFRHFLKP